MIEWINQSKNSLECSTVTTIVNRVVDCLSGGECHKEEYGTSIINQAGQLGYNHNMTMIRRMCMNTQVDMKMHKRIMKFICEDQTWRMT